MNNLVVRLWDAIIAESDTHGAGFKNRLPNFGTQPESRSGGICHPSEGAMRDRNQARPGDFPIGSVQSRAAARAMFAEQVSDDLVVDMAGLPSFAHATNRVRGLRRL